MTPLEDYFTIRDERGKIFPIIGMILLVLQVGTSQSSLTFLFAKQLKTEVFLGCNYYNRYVEVIRPRLRQVEIDNAPSTPL